MVSGGYYNNGFDTYQQGYSGGGDGPPVGYGSYGRLAYGGQPAVGGGYRNIGSRGGMGGGGGGRGGFGMGAGGGQGASRGKRPFIGGVINRGNVFETQTGHSVHMRGLPYSATEDDIAQVGLSTLSVLHF